MSDFLVAAVAVIVVFRNDLDTVAVLVEAGVAAGAIHHRVKVFHVLIKANQTVGVHHPIVTQKVALLKLRLNLLKALLQFTSHQQEYHLILLLKGFFLFFAHVLSG